MVATRPLGPRVVDLTIDSPALGRTAAVRLLLPRHYQAQPNRRWPVLWLLHGCCDTYQSWTRSTDVEQLAGLADVLVVMPEAGKVGYYSDWYHPGRDGPSRWETFHLTELRQLLERDWHAGDRRAVAGLSMGGLGAMAYAARHPGMFRAAASYSGWCTPATRGPPPQAPRSSRARCATSTKIQTPCGATRGGRPAPGPRTIPTTSHPGCAACACSCRSATGSPARSPPRGRRPSRPCTPQNAAFVERLRQLRIPVRVDAYRPGTHDWPYWQRELHRSLPLLLAALQEH